MEPGGSSECSLVTQHSGLLCLTPQWSFGSLHLKVAATGFMLPHSGRKPATRGRLAMNKEVSPGDRLMEALKLVLELSLSQEVFLGR